MRMELLLPFIHSSLQSHMVCIVHGESGHFDHDGLASGIVALWPEHPPKDVCRRAPLDFPDASDRVLELACCFVDYSEGLAILKPMHSQVSSLRRRHRASDSFPSLTRRCTGRGSRDMGPIGEVCPDPLWLWRIVIFIGWSLACIFPIVEGILHCWIRNFSEVLSSWTTQMPGWSFKLLFGLISTLANSPGTLVMVIGLLESLVTSTSSPHGKNDAVSSIVLIAKVELVSAQLCTIPRNLTELSS